MRYLDHAAGVVEPRWILEDSLSWIDGAENLGDQGGLVCRTRSGLHRNGTLESAEDAPTSVHGCEARGRTNRKN